MKSNPSSTADLQWSSPIKQLYRGGKSKIADQLAEAGFHTLEDLRWIPPLKVQLIPPTQSFSLLQEGSFFRGSGTIISHQTRPNFRARGKGRSLLHNIQLVVKDHHSPLTIHLRWFNAYQSMNQKISSLKEITFVGQVQTYNNLFQIVNPEFDAYTPSVVFENEVKVSYPTVNKVSPTQLQQLFRKIPDCLWEQIEDPLSPELTEKRDYLPLGQAFKVLHGLVPPSELTPTLREKARMRLIYEEFFNDQIKVFLRREKNQQITAPTYQISDHQLATCLQNFPFELTIDQQTALSHIRTDLGRPIPMMRLVQGDVGCGKTAVALAGACVCLEAGAQVAFMCPTESLANQHYETAKRFLPPHYKIGRLLGGQKPSEKKAIQEQLSRGELQLVIGTHTLIQDSVQFKNLALAIVDEQHKFGVEQRLKLTRKGQGVHCLIMTATPIPRSLSLTQYGDLDITTIKTMPLGRRGHKTRIIREENYPKYLSFLKTRLDLGEQVFVVVPAIEESQMKDISNLHEVLAQYSDYFPTYQCVGLHGQMSSEEKQETLKAFRDKKIQLLVATSVIEVGIDVPNATVLSIINPERFGLSSLHQLRGRVGRGDKPGFCFLVVRNQISHEALQRLQVIEKNTDGFTIAEEDLKIRGEGDLFGQEQSGDLTHRRLGNLLRDQQQLIEAREDAQYLLGHNPASLSSYINRWERDEKVFSTI